MYRAAALPPTVGFGDMHFDNITVQARPADPPLVLPTMPAHPPLVLTRGPATGGGGTDDASGGAGGAGGVGSEGEWVTGRAGMLYRDLLPDRLGGRFIASHIRIAEGGAVPDYVHYHKVHFQMIFVIRGWVKVVYEGQGPPFVMRAGDCVLQPPTIRHRVLESSGPLEVVEVGCPAEHVTMADPLLQLPTPVAEPQRRFGGQRFARHRARGAQWGAWRSAQHGFDAFEARDSGIAAASDGVASACVARVHRHAHSHNRSKLSGGGGKASASASAAAEAPDAARTPALVAHDAELLLLFVLRGSASFTHVESRDGGQSTVRIQPADAIAVPAGMPHALSAWSTDFELLEVAQPARVNWRSVLNSASWAKGVRDGWLSLDMPKEDGGGLTALSIGAWHGHYEIMRYLLGRGADPNGPCNNGWRPLMVAATRGNQRIMRLLIDAGADVNAISKQSRYTALMFAADKGNADAVRLLIDSGASLELRDAKGKTALQMARSNNRTEAVVELEDGASAAGSDDTRSEL
eukprot:g1747.t1